MPCAACTSGRSPVRGIRSSSSRRCAPRCSRSPTTWPSSRPSNSSRAGAGTTSRPSQRSSSTSHMPASTWSPGAASSRCAAASSTCSRPPPSTRCASSSSATRSRRCAPSRSPTSARCPSPSSGCRSRRVASCCSPRPCASARARWCTSSRASPACSRRSPRASPSRAWSRSRPPCSSGSCRSPTTCPRVPRSRCSRPSGSPARAVSLAETNREFLSAAWSAATAGAEAPIDLAAGDFLTVRQLRDAALFSAPGEPDPRRVWWNFSSFDIGDAAEVVASTEGEGAAAAAAASTTVRLAANAVPSFRATSPGAVDHAAERAARRLEPGRGIRRSRTRRARARRARRSRARGAPGRRGPRRARSRASPTSCRPTRRAASSCPRRSWALIAEAEFYGRAAGYDARQVKKLASRRRNVVDPLQLKAGDYVVHQTHGIGRFVEMVQREVATGSRPTGRAAPRHPAAADRRARVPRARVRAVASAATPGDKLFVPTDQLDLLTRYVGGEAPALSKMGGSDWAQAKGRARKAVRDIAVELVKLYSRAHGGARGTPSRPTPRGSASSRRRSRSPRRPTSCRPSTR